MKKTPLLNSKKAETKPTSFNRIVYPKSKDRSYNDPKNPGLYYDCVCNEFYSIVIAGVDKKISEMLRLLISF